LLNQFPLRKTRKIAKEEMEEAIKLSVPLVVGTKGGKNWGQMRA
jgi:DNA polymerase-1